MDPYAGFTLDAAEISALPLHELALRVLYDVDAAGEWNWHNWMVKAQQGSYGQSPEALGVLSEAWNWLLCHGLVVWNPSQSSDSAIMISRRGRATLDEGLSWLRAVERLAVDLVPALEHQARPQFLRGDFETAAFVAMKEVEVGVRTLAGLPDSVLGTNLMQEAFGLNGPLRRADIDGGESVALMELFKGAIGLFTNPSSHRRVDFSASYGISEYVSACSIHPSDPAPSTVTVVPG
jgi:uncharacterized protein (TIGR02391 family)